MSKNHPRPTKYRIPREIRPFTHLVNNTGGNDIEDLLNQKVDPRTNEVLSLLQICVRCQLTLLSHLHRDGLLMSPKSK